MSIQPSPSCRRPFPESDPHLSSSSREHIRGRGTNTSPRAHPCCRSNKEHNYKLNLASRCRWIHRRPASWFTILVKTVEERFKASVEDRREDLESLLRECTKEDAGPMREQYPG
nr:uncharacterized protein LOC112776147 [Arachis hypogaea]